MLSTTLAVIPYTTHPTIELGPLTLRTFGLMTAIGVVLGIWFAAVHGERFGMHRDDVYRLGTRMVLAGVVGARLTWVLTHLDQIESPIDVIAVWEGGLQFSGGFIAAIALGLPTFLTWNRIQRWQLLDGFAVAVLVGAGFGRLGCLAVGEHFGRQSDFLLATRYDGGEVREPALGLTADAVAVTPGVSFLNPALYECVTVFALFGLLWWMLVRRRPSPGTIGGIFLLTYAVQRFTFDSMRVNDERLAGLTGAQWMCVAMVPIGIYVLTRVRPQVAARLAAGEVGGVPVVETSTTTTASGAAVSTTKRRASGRPAHTTRTAVATDGDAVSGDDDEVTDESDGDADRSDADGTDGLDADGDPGEEDDPGDDPSEDRRG